MEDNNIKSCVYFFLDDQDNIKINKTNNTEKEIRDIYSIGDDSPAFLFAYDYYGKRLHVTNVSGSSLLNLLECKKKSKKGESLDKFEKVSVRQIETVESYLKSVYDWDGKIASGPPHQDKSVSQLRVSDFNNASKYISSVMDRFNFKYKDVDVHVVPELSSQSKFIGRQSVCIEGGIKAKGPAILIRKSNSSKKCFENIVIQYLFNLPDILGFDVGDTDFMEEGLVDYVEETLPNFIEHDSLDFITYWYLASKNGNVYLDENSKRLSVSELKELHTFNIVIPFSYHDNDNHKYVMIENIGVSAYMSAGAHKEMVGFLMDNLDKIDHEDKAPPMILFKEYHRKPSLSYMSNFQPWLYIKNMLSGIYKFTPKDIRVLKGEFDGDFSAMYVNESNATGKAIAESNTTTDVQYPIILWNDSNQDSSSKIGHFHNLINEYLKFIEDFDGIQINHYSLKDNKEKEYFESFRDDVIHNDEARYAFENEMIIILNDTDHLHKFNLFNLYLDILSFHRDKIEKVMSFGDGAELSDIASLSTEIQQKLYFIVLKAMGLVLRLKYGLDYRSREEIHKGDLVINEGNGAANLMRVVGIRLGDEDSDNNKVYECKDLVTDRFYFLSDKRLFLFKIEIDDKKMYNNRVITASKKGEDLSYYRDLLKQFVLHQKRINPVDKPNEEKEHPTMERWLRDEVDFFDHNTRAFLTETLLSDNRKVKYD
jgi:hypothetical protein